MVSKEEKKFKNEYLQQPIISPLLTEENLKILENHCKNSLTRDIGKRFREHEIVLNLLYSYKEQEADKKKLIEKLEEDITKANKIINDKDYRYIEEVINEQYERREYAQEILKILKGEKE